MSRLALDRDGGQNAIITNVNLFDQLRRRRVVVSGGGGAEVTADTKAAAEAVRCDLFPYYAFHFKSFAIFIAAGSDLDSAELEQYSQSRSSYIKTNFLT